MNSTAKALLIPVAAFAVTMSGAVAFKRDVLVNAGLNDDQISAFVTAQDLREKGDKEAARDTLVQAGIDDGVMRAVSNAMQTYKQQHQDALQTAVANNDFAAFQAAAVGSPLADLIMNEQDFARFVAAARTRQANSQDITV